MKTRTFMKKSLALLLTVLMVLSSVVTSALVFTAGAEEVNEAELLASDGSQLATGTLPEVVTAATNSTETGTTIRILKDFELTAQVTIPNKVTAVEGDGHTIYMAEALSTKSGVASFITTKATITFRNLNLNGQPMNYTGTEPVKFGVDVTGDTGAIGFAGGSAKLIMENCRIEGFHTLRTGSAMLATGTQTTNVGGVYLTDTVITGNYSYGATYREKGCAIRTRTGGSGGTEVYVYGNTVIDGNFDKNGGPGNIFSAEQGSPTSAYQHTCVFVDSSFTGVVGLSTNFRAAFDEDGKLTKRGAIYFDEGYRSGIVKCMYGGAENYAIPDANGYGTLHTNPVAYHAAYNTDGSVNRAWASGTLAGAIAVMTNAKTAPRDESGNLIENPTEEQLKAAAALSTILICADFSRSSHTDPTGACYTIYGNGYTFTRSASDAAPMLRFNYNGSNKSYVVVNDLVLDGDCVVEETDGTLTPTHQYFTGNQGAAVHMTNGFLELNGVTIRNIFQSGSGPLGGAVFLMVSGKAFLNAVTIQNCYSKGYGLVETSSNTGAGKFYLSGDCHFENNYTMTFDGTNVTSRTRSDIRVRSAEQLYLDGSFTGEVAISKDDAYTAKEVAFANLKEGDTLNDGAIFKNVVNEDCSVWVGTTATNGYYPLTWLVQGDKDEAQNMTTGDTGSLAGLIWAANANDTIVLLKDIETKVQIDIDKPLVIDGQNHKITQTTSNTGHLLNVTKEASGLELKNLVLHGGGVTAGKWEGAIGSTDTKLVNLPGGNTKITLENCTLTGQRVYTTGEVNSTAIIPANAYVYFKGTTVIMDNISFGITSASDTTFKAGNGTSAIRNNGSGLMAFEGHVTLRKNYAVSKCNDDGTYELSAANCVPGGGSANNGYKRILINGDLESGSELWLDSGVGFMVAINPETGMPYTGISDGVRRGYGAKWPSYIVSTPNAGTGDVALNTANDGTLAAKYFFCSTTTQTIGDLSAGGNLDQDKLVLKILVSAAMADSEKTFVSVKIGSGTAIVKPLSAFAVQSADTDTTASKTGTTVIPVILPMPQLTDDIVISIYTEGNESEPLKSITYSAKQYIDGVIALNGDNESLKNVLYALLNFGGYAQTFFGYNTDNLANADIKGTENDMVAGKSYSFTADNVKATRSGTPNNAVFRGASLILDGEISLRFYLNLTNEKTPSDFTCKVGETEYEIQKDSNGFYVEVAHIGTAKLGDRIALEITENGGSTVTYSCSPMTYVNTVKNMAEGTVKQELKDVCDALFYYYHFASVYFGFDDATGSSLSDTAQLRVYTDPVNSYGALSDVTVA